MKVPQAALLLRYTVNICIFTLVTTSSVMHINFSANQAVSTPVTLTDKMTAATDKATITVETETTAN